MEAEREVGGETGEDANEEVAVGESGDHTQKMKSFFHSLEKRRNECEAQGKYKQAQVAEKRIEQLKKVEKRRACVALTTKHAAEKKLVQEQQQKQLDKLVQTWSRELRLFDVKANESISALKGRYDATVKELRDAREKSTENNTHSLTSRHSISLERMRKTQQAYAKIKDYDRAAEVKAQADKLEVDINRLQTSEWKQHLAGMKSSLKRKQVNEMKVLQQRSEASRQKIQRSRDEDVHQKKLKFKHFLTELDRTQKKELALLQKTAASLITFS